MKKIAVVTSSRADYSHLYWVLRELDGNPEIELQLVVAASHLAAEFGSTVREIERDGFSISARLETLLSSDTDVGMAKGIGLGVLSFADWLGANRPDALLLIADRYEMLAPAAAALALRIPIAHIEGGELSEGAIDDAVRHALTKMSHIHFCSTETARQRVISMGEEPWRTHHAGAPSLDHLRRGGLPTLEELEAWHGLDLREPTIVVAYHPVTLNRDTLSEVEALFEGLRTVEANLVFCYPNADAGSRELVERTRSFLASHGHGRIFTNLPATHYWALLREATMTIGNSSSGIMEAASYGLPTVNVGERQAGRERARNVLDAAPTGSAIREAIARAQDPGFRASLQGMENPYGDGHASERIAAVLSTLPDRDRLLRKHFYESRG